MTIRSTIKPTRSGSISRSTVGAHSPSRDYADPDRLVGRSGRVADEVGKRLRVKPSTVSQWLHSTSVATLQEKLALVLEVCGELGAHRLAAQVMAPIRAVEVVLPSRPLREILHDYREADALVDVLALRHFDQPTSALKPLKAALAWSNHTSATALRALRETP